MTRAHRKNSPADSTLARGDKLFDDYFSFRGARDGNRLNARRDDDGIVAAGVERIADVQHIARGNAEMFREPLHAVGFIHVFARYVDSRHSTYENLEFGERLFQRLPEQSPF